MFGCIHSEIQKTNLTDAFQTFWRLQHINNPVRETNHGATLGLLTRLITGVMGQLICVPIQIGLGALHL